MKSLSRFGVSIDTQLLKDFDAFIARAGYIGRSEAFRDLIRTRLAEEEMDDPGRQVIGALTIVYDHHHRRLEEKLTDIQHAFHERVITTTHVHIDHHNCMEVILLRGKVKEVKEISLQLSSQKGVTHTQLSMTTVQGEHFHS